MWVLAGMPSSSSPRKANADSLRNVCETVSRANTDKLAQHVCVFVCVTVSIGCFRHWFCGSF